MIDDNRFSIIRPYMHEWNLQINDVIWEDEGNYRCTVNTQPVKSKMVMLHVKGTNNIEVVYLFYNFLTIYPLKKDFHMY